MDQRINNLENGIIEELRGLSVALGIPEIWQKLDERILWRRTHQMESHRILAPTGSKFSPPSSLVSMAPSYKYDHKRVSASSPSGNVSLAFSEQLYAYDRLY